MATVVFLRDTTNNIANIPIVDGQIILSTDENFIYLDNGNQRIQYRNNGISSGVQYDNTTSGLAGDDVQSAIDELSARTQLATTSNAGIVKPDGISITVDANGKISTPSQTASTISYSNTSSHLSANKVQGAIDELKSLIDQLADVVQNHSNQISTLNTTVGNKLDKSAMSLSGTTLNITL